MITVYGKPDCIQCDRTVKALDRAGVDYQPRDVTQDPEAYRHVTETLGYRQVPVVVHQTDTGTEHWSGYQPARIKQLTTAGHRPDAATITAATTASTMTVR
ncbi:glutaredoxin family protein [Kocuria coralli]